MIGIVVLLAGTLFGQAQVSGGGSFGSSGPMPFAPPIVAGAPYSGEQVSEQVQTLADGTHITQKMAGAKTYRDSQGRTRTERPLMGPMTGGQSADRPIVVQIIDPVAGFEYTLDAQNRVAHRTVLPPPGSRPSATGTATVGWAGTASAGVSVGSRARPASGGGANRPTISSESLSLGTQMINGVLAEGRRTTMTWPVGSQGNDRPIVATTEAWTASDLKIMVLFKNVDPRSGEITTQIINLSHSEPDPSLFQVPPDYTVTDETGPFTIRYSR